LILLNYFEFEKTIFNTITSPISPKGWARKRSPSPYPSEAQPRHNQQ